MGCSDLDSIAKDNMQRLYANAFMLLGSKHDAEDAAEEAIYQLYRRKPEFESDEHARAWLIRVTVNAALKQFRRRKFISDNSENELDAAAVDFDFSDRSDIIKAVHSLPTKLRTVIMLYYYDDMSSSEISRLLKIPQSTVTTRLSRGRKALKELLKGEYDYE